MQKLAIDIEQAGTVLLASHDMAVPEFVVKRLFHCNLHRLSSIGDSVNDRSWREQTLRQ